MAEDIAGGLVVAMPSQQDYDNLISAKRVAGRGVNSNALNYFYKDRADPLFTNIKIADIIKYKKIKYILEYTS